MDKIISKIPISLNNITRSTLTDYFINSWSLNELLFDSIKNEKGYYLKPEVLRHPPIFYYGHTAVFYINQLCAAGLLKSPINQTYEKLFAKGIDPMSPDEISTINWPSVDSVRLYRQQVYEIILTVITEIDLPSNINEHSPLWALLMSMEHERIHFETSSVIFRQLPIEELKKPLSWQYASTKPNPSKIKKIALLDIPSMSIELHKKNRSIFGWDNEYGYLKIDVPAFQISRNLITNIEYKDFVDSGSYCTKEYWSEEGWLWKTLSNSKKPKFWIKTNDNYEYRAMFDQFDLPEHWPVEVNCYEAEAYCNWLGAGSRLMSEAEYRAILTRQDNENDDLNHEIYNINLKYGSPCNIPDISDEENNLLRINDLRGNVWQWLSNDFYPLEGFKPHPYYLDFSLPFFGSNHGMLAGGSWITTGTSASINYRLWFRRQFYQHAGFRVCRG